MSEMNPTDRERYEQDAEFGRVVEECDKLRADLAHEKTMRAGAEHRATYCEKTQQEYARTVETLKADNARLRALITEASITLSALRPHLTLKTTEEWEQLESLHNRLAAASSDGAVR